MSGACTVVTGASGGIGEVVARRLIARGEAVLAVARNADRLRALCGDAQHARFAAVDLERPGRPQLWGQGYFALGDADAGAAYLRDYYAFTGPFAEKVAAGNLTSGRAVKDFVRGYAEAGCDHPTVLDALSEPLVPLEACWMVETLAGAEPGTLLRHHV